MGLNGHERCRRIRLAKKYYPDEEIKRIDSTDYTGLTRVFAVFEYIEEDQVYVRFTDLMSLDEAQIKYYKIRRTYKDRQFTIMTEKKALIASLGRLG